MPQIPAYERDPYLRQLAVQVLGVREDAESRLVELDDTVCYPEGGGQPSDRGWLDEAEVIEVVRSDRGILHRIKGGPIAPGPARLVLDWDRRFDHMQQHTAQHLLTREASNRFGWTTRSFHIGPRVSDIELDCRPPGRDSIAELEEAVASIIRQSRPIRAFRVEPEDLSSLEVRSRGLPADHTGSVRLVEIEGFDLNTCGGTHVASTAEVESVKVVGGEPLRGGCRLAWIAGRRVRGRLARDESHLKTLRGLLDCADGELAAVIGKKLEQLREQRSQNRRMELQVAAARAEQLSRGGGDVVDHHLERDEARLLRPLAEALAKRMKRQLALLTAETEAGPRFAVVVGPEREGQLAEIGREVAANLKGRGGGAGRVFQGKAGSLNRRDRALSRLREHIDR